MKFLVYFVLPALSYAASLDYGGGNDGYSAQQGGYETKCTSYFETVFNERCESYSDRLCQTRQQEACVDIPMQTCRAEINSQQVRKCFNVTELQCSLREDVQFEVVQVPFTVQKCRKVPERICNTAYDTSFSTKEDFQCLNVQNPVCSNEERTIYEKTCRTTTTFECDTEAGYPSNNAGGAVNFGGSNTGYPTGDSYNAPVAPVYGAPAEPKCRRSQDTKCHQTPRTVFVQSCRQNQEKACETLTETFPTANERQACRSEDRKVCDLEHRTQPKQVKKYVYSKQCRSVPRRICENAESKQLTPSCSTTSRRECSYTPVEQCEDIPKQHCVQVPSQVKKEKCEQVPVYGGANEGY